MRSHSLNLAALLLAMALAGCGSSPKTNFYTLSSGTAPVKADAKAAYTVALGAIGLPDSLDRPQLVLRAGANQVTIAEFERWSGPLKGEIGSAIAENLTQQLSGASVFAYPQSATVNADYRVMIDVQRLDSALGDAATIDVAWQVQPAKGESKGGRSVARESAGGAGYDALIAAHARALASVSRDIAAAINLRATGAAVR